MTHKLVLDIEKIPLSGQDLLDIAGCLSTSNIKYILYDDLKKHRSVESLFGETTHSIYILLMIKNQENNSQSVGHWVCFIRNKDRNEYYWYDPYGLRIAEELDLTHEPKYIIDLTKNMNIRENTHRHQKFSSDISTCGRHCVLRSVFWHLDNDEYNKLVISPMVPRPIREADSLVALMTGLASKSDKHLIAFYNKLGKKNEMN